MKNTEPKKPTLEKIARKGFRFKSQLFEWEIYAKKDKRIAYNPKEDKIMTTYRIKEREK